MYRVVYSDCDDYVKLNDDNIMYVENMSVKNAMHIMQMMFELGSMYAHVFENGIYYSSFGGLITNL